MSDRCKCGHLREGHAGGCRWGSCSCDTFEFEEHPGGLFRSVGFLDDDYSWMVAGPETGDGAPIYASGMARPLAEWLASELCRRCTCEGPGHECLPRVGNDDE
mgnify:CR=1 FL=1